MTHHAERRRRNAALMQLAAEVLRRVPEGDRHTASLVRALERAAAGELVGPRGEAVAVG